MPDQSALFQSGNAEKAWIISKTHETKKRLALFLGEAPETDLAGCPANPTAGNRISLNVF
jgi:hypothetical protein